MTTMSANIEEGKFLYEIYTEVVRNQGMLISLMTVLAEQVSHDTGKDLKTIRLMIAQEADSQASRLISEFEDRFGFTPVKEADDGQSSRSR